MSIRSPEIKPIYIPSRFPRMSPKAATIIIMRFGAIPANDRVWNVVVCNTKHIEIIINNTIFLSIVNSYSVISELPTSFVSKITSTSSKCSKSATGVIVPILVKLFGPFSTLEIYPIKIP